MSESVVIVGAGQAAAQLVASLRSEGFTGPITMIGNEPHLPYQRPPLSKAFLAGDLALERLFIRPQEFYDEAKCELLLDFTVTAIDRTAKTVTLDDGRTLKYGTLVLATGSRVRHLSAGGREVPRIQYLRGIADVEGIRPALKRDVRLVVIGAGYIGLEVAAVARKHGAQVTVLEMAPRVMARTVSPPVSAFYEAEHRKAGVLIHLNAKVNGIAQNSSFEIDSSAGVLPADVVVAGVGILPNMELAEAAGIKTANGIVVDQFARTSDADVYAIGDCADQPCGFSTSGRARLESVQNAIDQAKHAAAAICGKPKPYAEVPWFWSDQYDLKLQIAGLAAPGDELVVRGDPASRSFAVFTLRNGSIAAVEAVNAAPEYMMGRRLIAARAQVAPARLADRGVPMKDMLSEKGGA